MRKKLLYCNEPGSTYSRGWNIPYSLTARPESWRMYNLVCGGTCQGSTCQGREIDGSDTNKLIFHNLKNWWVTYDTWWCSGSLFQACISNAAVARSGLFWNHSEWTLHKEAGGVCITGTRVPAQTQSLAGLTPSLIAGRAWYLIGRWKRQQM